MAGEVQFNNGLTYATGVADVLNGLLTDIIDQDKQSYIGKQTEDLKTKMHFTETKALNPEQKFTEMVGAYELDEIVEGESLPMIDVEKGADKGFELKIFGNKLKITKYFMERLKQNQNIAGADSLIKSYYNRLASATINLSRGAMKTKYDEMAQLIAKATSTANAFGPGSATAYGVSLANASHPIMNSTSTFSNVLDGSGQTLNKALSATSLQRALDNHKTALKMQNGDFVGNSAGIYELRVPRALEQAARVILQSQDKTKLIYAGTGSNAALLNTFTFSGNTVELKVIEPRGRTLKDGTTLGSSTLRALVNPEVLKEGKALRIITLWNENVETHYDFDTKNYFASIDLSFSVDHYGAQYGLVRSSGVA